MAVQIIREVAADVVKRGGTRAVYAKQNDVNSRFLNVRIQEDGKDITIDPALIVMLNVQRSDHREHTFYGTVNGDGTVQVPLTSWMLELAGTLVCDVSIVSEDPAVSKLTTMQFNIYVEEAVVSDSVVDNTAEYSVIVDLLNRTAAAEQSVSKAAEDAAYVKEQCEKVTEEASEVVGLAREVLESGRVRKIATLDGRPMYFFFGTQAEYEALTEVQKRNLFAIITDDSSVETLNSVRSELDSIFKGEVGVPKATNADMVLCDGVYVTAENLSVGSAMYANMATSATSAASAVSANMLNPAMRAKMLIDSSNRVWWPPDLIFHYNRIYGLMLYQYGYCAFTTIIVPTLSPNVTPVNEYTGTIGKYGFVLNMLNKFIIFKNLDGTDLSTSLIGGEVQLYEMSAFLQSIIG